MLFVGRTLALSTAQIAARDGFNNRIARGLLRDVSCLCGSRNFDRIANSDRQGLAQPVAICRLCGLIQLNPRMGEEEYREFYESDCYRLLYDGEAYLSNFERLYTAKQGERILWAVQKAGDKIGSAVEIGCGGGWNLMAFQNAGAKVCGWDYSAHLVQLGRDHGVPLQRGSIKDALAMGDRYDVIILNHVLEHFLDPVSQLCDLHGLLNPGGCLYVGVPATDYPSVSLLQNAHTYYFTDKTLAHYLALAGWNAGGIIHEDHFAMYTVARADDCAPQPLETEYRDSLARLKKNRLAARGLGAWYHMRERFVLFLYRLGVYSFVRTIYRRVMR